MSEQRFIKNFRVIAELSSGGFGQTFLAEDTESGRGKCVIKQLKPQATDADSLSIAKRLFEQEVEILYRLGEHEQIPALITHFEENGEFYLVQEYIEGETLAEELAAGKIYGTEEVWMLVIQLMQILHFVHGHDVIHRDIKPSNIIRRKNNGQPVLIDFGAGKKVQSRASIAPNESTATIAIGSDGFMPIEQLAGHPRFNSDIYAVGMLAIQLLTQVHPSRLFQNQRTGEWVWQDKISINYRFAAIISQMVRYDFRQRYNSASEVFNALKVLNFQPPVISSAQNHPAQNSENNQVFQPKPPTNQTMMTFAAPVRNSFEPSDNFTQAGNPTSTKFENYTQYRTPASLPPPANVKNDVIFSDSSDYRPLKIILFLFVGFITLCVTYASFLANGNNYPTENYQNELAYQNQLASSPPMPNFDNEKAFNLAELKEKEAIAAEVYVPDKAKWGQISNLWTEAARLYASVQPNSPDANLAKIKQTQCVEKAKTALLYANGKSAEKSSSSSYSSKTSPSYSSKSSTSSTSYTSPSSSSTPYPTATPTPKPATPSIPAAKGGSNYLSINYTTGSYREKIKSETFTPTEGNFSASISKTSYQGMVVRIGFDGGPDDFSAEFAAPQKMLLGVGNYTGATRSPFQSPTKPGFSFSGRGSGCNELSAEFTINRIGYSSDKTKLLYFDATFVQRCEHANPPLMGRIRYTAQ